MLIDPHVHLETFSTDEIEEIMNRANNAGIAGVISAGVDLKTSKKSIKLSKKFTNIFSGVGIHPMNIPKDLNEEIFLEIHNLALNSEKVLVISEIGLDFTGDISNRKNQFDVFRQQIRIALELKLPIVFHSRESHEEVLRILREEKAYEVGGIMHYFQGDENIANQAINLGFYLSFAKPLLRYPHLQKIISNLNLNKIIVETDTYPQRFKTNRNKWTEPKDLVLIISKISEIKKMSFNEIEANIHNNLKSLLKNKWHIIDKYLIDN